MNMGKRKLMQGQVSQISYLLSECLDSFGESLVSVVLFGSYARKNYDENSDLDLMIIVDKEDRDLSELRKSYLLKFGRRLDLHVFSKEDVVQNFRDFSPLFSTLLLGKKILFDKDMFFERLFNAFVKVMVNMDIKYCEGGKIWELKKIARNLEVSH